MNRMCSICGCFFSSTNALDTKCHTCTGTSGAVARTKTFNYTHLGSSGDVYTGVPQNWNSIPTFKAEDFRSSLLKSILSGDFERDLNLVIDEYLENNPDAVIPVKDVLVESLVTFVKKFT